MTRELNDILESCLQELDHGVGIDEILSRFPDHEEDLRPILKSALMAANQTVSPPSQAASLRGRARLMQRVAELQEEKSAPRKHAIPFLQRIAISFVLTATLLLSGTGLVGASSAALPGQNLYPVKRSWEDLRLFFTFNEQDRNTLEMEFEGERLDEVDELLSNQSDEDHLLVDFSGIYTSVNGKSHISKVQVLFPVNTQLPPQGAALHITGRTTEKGYVEIISFDILPAGSIVPGDSTIQITPLPSGETENETDGE